MHLCGALPNTYKGNFRCYSSFDSPSSGYWRNRWTGSEYAYGYEENERLDTVYDILDAFGYEMSDEEEQAKNGTHPLFPKEADESEGE